MANRVSEMLGFTKDTEGEQNGDLPSFCPKATKGTSKILIPFALIWRERESNPLKYRISAFSVAFRGSVRVYKNLFGSQKVPKEIPLGIF